MNRIKYLIFFIFLLSSLSANASRVDRINNNYPAVKIALTEIPSSFSPYSLKPLNAQFCHLFFDPLVRWTKENKIEYRLLEKYEQSTDGKLRFYLRKNILFHSGETLTSADVLWSFNEALKNQKLQNKLYHKIKLVPIDKYQFEIITTLTLERLFDHLTQLYILDSQFYANNPAALHAQQNTLPSPLTTLALSGSGPYQVSAFYAGVNLQVQASANYWQQQPIFKSLNFVKIRSIESRLYALLAGDIDITESIDNKSITSPYLLENKNVLQVTAKNALFLTINSNNNALFENKVARQTLHLAINQSGMLKHIFNNTGSVNSVLAVRKLKTETPVYNVERAKYLLKNSDIPDKLSLLVMLDDSKYTKEVLHALTNMLKRVGIELVVTEVNRLKQWRALQFEHDLTLSTWQTPLVNTDNIYP